MRPVSPIISNSPSISHQKSNSDLQLIISMDSTPSFQFAKDAEPPNLLSHKYILPEQARPHLSQVSSSSVPIIDLQSYIDVKDDHSHYLVQAISEACQKYGFFQIINHGVSEEISNSVMSSAAEFFKLPHQIRSELFLKGYAADQVLVYNPSMKVDGQDDQVNMWSESFSHVCHLTDDDDDAKLPQSLNKYVPNYREVIGEYAKQIDVLVSRLLSLMSLGLGLDKDCLKTKIGDKCVLRAGTNYYPPCLDPELTIGLPAHTDINVLTVLRQSEHVPGLQLLMNEKWVSVDPLPNAFVINVGDQIQVLSNGRYKSGNHRAVNHKDCTRVSLAMGYLPCEDQTIEPIKDLISDDNPPTYVKYRFSDYLNEFFKQVGTKGNVMKVFELQPQQSASM